MDPTSRIIWMVALHLASKQQLLPYISKNKNVPDGPGSISGSYLKHPCQIQFCGSHKM